MEKQSSSIFFSSLRAFCISIFTVLGFCAGLFLFFTLVGTASTDDLQSRTDYKVVPSANGERKSLGRNNPVILQLDIDGFIGLKELTTDRVRSFLTESREGTFKEGRVKAILLNINSPGGSSFDSMSIHRMLKEYKEQYGVPIIAYTDGVCASGSLMIAAAADKIVAAEGSIVGSVGVITNTFFNASELLKKHDIQTLTIYRGKNKDALNPWRAWKEDEAAPIQSIVDYHYDIFVNMMSDNRPSLDRDKLIHEYGASIYSAEKAAELGYIDAAGYNYSRAIELAANAAGLAEKEYSVVKFTHKMWFSDLLNENSPFLHGKIDHQLQLYPVPLELMNQILYLYVPGAA